MVAFISLGEATHRNTAPGARHCGLDMAIRVKGLGRPRRKVMLTCRIGELYVWMV
jgi:hypothetical protein